VHYKSFGFLAVLRAYEGAALRACGVTGVRRYVLAAIGDLLPSGPAVDAQQL